MKNFSAFLLSGLIFCLSVSQLSAQTLAFLDDKEIENRVENLLLKRDVGELANELAANKKPPTISERLIKLSVFARAGQRGRVHEALREIGKIYPSAENKEQIFRVARRAVSNDDFVAQRIFYELIAVNGNDNARVFTDLWSKKGDVRELENWLKARAQTGEIWWFEWVELKKRRGTANEIADEIKSRVKENPSDFALVDKYLYVVSRITPSSVGFGSVSYEQDISWLAETVAPESAYAAYEIGKIFKEENPAIAEKLFLKSLSMPYTEKAAKLFGERAFRYASIPPMVKNPEKQLRFWTKKELAEIYLKTNQPQFAQPLAEELTATDTSDIQASNENFTAGMVQAASGQRVIETKILNEQAVNENSPEYWLNRISYYAGRKEPEQIRRDFQKALEKFPYQPNDLKASFARVRILFELSRHDSRGEKDETAAILRKDFIEAKKNNDFAYLYYLARIISNDFEDLNDEFFVNSNLLPQILATRTSWSSEEQNVIETVLESEKWSARERETVWNRLTDLARRDVRRRAFSLVEAMDGNNRNAVPLLKECLKIAPLEYEDGFNFDRADVEQKLFEVYLARGDWKEAEKIFNGGFRYRGNELGRIAVVAAKSGSVADAARVWKIYSNFDRRNLGSEFYELTATAVKPLLREYYLSLKKTDAANETLDKALSALN